MRVGIHMWYIAVFYEHKLLFAIAFDFVVICKGGHNQVASASLTYTYTCSWN